MNIRELKQILNNYPDDWRIALTRVEGCFIEPSSHGFYPAKFYSPDTWVYIADRESDEPDTLMLYSQTRGCN